MYEDMTYEAILEDALSRVPSDVDKREGSIIYDTLAPVCYKLAECYASLGSLTDLLFGDTAVGEFLDRFVNDYGMTRKQAVPAIRQVTANEAITIGSRWAVNDVVYDITALTSDGVYSAKCETAGSVGNTYTGQLSNIDNTSDAEVTLGDIITPGEDEETDDALRARFYKSARQAAFGGNIADYEGKVLAVDGVGAVKVFPAHEMGAAGQVGLVIGDTQGNTASAAKVAEVQALMGTDGDGIAPIGHTVTVKTSADLSVDVAAAVRLKTGSSFAIIQPIVVQAITDYINAIGFADETVFFAKLQAVILDCHPDIVDIGTVTINGASANLALEKTFDSYQVPVVGTVTVTEVTG